MTATPLGQPLAALDTYALCDGEDHELRVITTGTHAYVYGLGANGTDCGPAHREGTQLTVACGQLDSDDEPCPGYVTVALDTPGAWTADPDAVRLLTSYGQAVEG